MAERKKCEGVVVPMVTPFEVDGEVDKDAAGRITRHLVTHGCSPFILGTTGEAVSVPAAQQPGYMNAVVEAADGKQPVYVGIASNRLKESIQMADQFSLAGANFAVAHLPFYYSLKPHQMKAYYLQLADAIDLPLILYNITSTTHMSIPPDVIFELSEHPNIVGIKDSERDIARQKELIEYCNEKDGFSHFIGWGAKGAWALSTGSDGLVPSTGNLVPALYRELCEAAKSGNMEGASHLQSEADAISAIYQQGRSLGESLAGLKVMMHELGLCGKEMLPPLMQLSSGDEQQILSDMEAMRVKQKAKLQKQYL